VLKESIEVFSKAEYALNESLPKSFGVEVGALAAQLKELVLGELNTLTGELTASLGKFRVGPLELKEVLPNLPFKVRRDPSTNKLSLEGHFETQLKDETFANVLTFASPRLSLDIRASSPVPNATPSSADGPSMSLKAELFAEALKISDLVTIPDFRIVVDERGRVRPEFDFNKVNFTGALKAISDAISKVAGPSNALKIRHEATRVLAEMQYDLPPIGEPSSAQIVGVSVRGWSAFQHVGSLCLEIGLGLSSKENPFAIVFLGLGGTGWARLCVKIDRLLETPSPNIEFELGLGVGAAAAIDKGFIKASGVIAVGVSVGIAGDKWSVSGWFSMRAEIDIGGLFSASLRLSAEIKNDNGTWVATASIYIKVKLFFFTLEVQREVKWSSAPEPSRSASIAATSDKSAPIGVYQGTLVYECDCLA
jgi:hypothetical protein